MKKQFYKQVGTQRQVTSIVQFYETPDDNGIFGYRYPFDGGDPEPLRKGDAVMSVIQISEKEFDNLMDAWATVYALSQAEGIRESDTNLLFSPKTKYSLIFDGILIEGYSDKEAVELNKFLQDMRGKCFVMKGEDGNPVAFINQDISYKASYVFEEAVED